MSYSLDSDWELEKDGGLGGESCSPGANSQVRWPFENADGQHAAATIATLTFPASIAPSPPSLSLYPVGSSRGTKH